MKTPEEHQAFFQEHWPALFDAARKSPEAAAALVAGFEDPLQRRILYFFSRPKLVFEDWDGKNADTIVGMGRNAIAELLAQSAAADDETETARLKDLANMTSYNLAADLADCWDEDGLKRTKAHFEAGLAAADDCVRWRDELGKDAGPKSMAWWAKGMHELSLGHADAAKSSWRRSLAFAEQAADTDDAFGIILGRGYLGLAEWLDGNAEGKTRFEDACGDFRKQLDDDKLKGDAKAGLEQLQVVRDRYAANA